MGKSWIEWFGSQHGLVFLGILGTYGALEAGWRVIKTTPVAWRNGAYKWRNRHLSRDFYYTDREYAYRIGADSRSYLYIRRETVVALQDLKEIPISYRWTGEGDTEPTIAPDSFTLVDAARIKGQARTRKLIRPASPLKKNDTVSYAFTVNCTVDGKEPEPFIGCSSSRRVDRLVLRVIFPLAHLPSRVWYVVQNPDGQEIIRKEVEKFDPITGEYRTEIRTPDAHLIYIMDWEY